MATSPSAGVDSLQGKMPNWTWQQSMLRIKDPAASVQFYCDFLGLTLVDKIDLPQYEFSLYFLMSFPKGSEYTLEPGSKEAHDFLWSTNGTTIELTHNYGTESKEGPVYHPGNADRDGFGHLAVSVEDVYAACSELEAKGVTFKKKPDEGRMKGLAFAYDPDGYWIEIISRGPAPNAPKFALAQTMLRVKDPKASIEFYVDKLGMKLVSVRSFSDFSLYFLASLPDGVQTPDPESPEAAAFLKEVLYPSSVPVLELTHNHGTESDADFSYHNGNVEPNRGFGHIGFLVDNIQESCAALEASGVKFQKKLGDGGIKEIAFALDPDGYWVEVVPRGGFEV
eukprot:CAMPEP_0117660314 /NCGR_PEP_ID=MMETSP0804-20121206/6903_1 /TAXON_ID=1074897 /ORGANISM="Tetraselmis astigmatica, Strain CCMP880" /LENGTH=337 /DNA_ID=CAMNT_0005467037 /DNA_START=214 /DNA_END=1227 /DNA_ORIENTATION=-